MFRAACFGLAGSVLLWIGAMWITRAAPRDPYAGIAYLPAVLVFASSLALLLWSFHWLAGVVAAALLTLGFVGLIRGWFY